MTTAPRRRPALIALVILAFFGCLALGWWQWTRWESTDGSFQNLGYALQWPLFAWFVVYAYRRYVKLEAEEAQMDSPQEMRELPADLLPPRPRAASEPIDATRAEYNRMLHELNEKKNGSQP
ncbi:hypothetical protein [Smaragdicoccus niigatensis]|uniref:hypothetical protein n=1 Tax=Smaragdicoccus niigatensis TaxID=359359 RepID=UPI00035F4AA1|nr:hypothetical protein [Smaragdicoccus niigatensis]